MTFSKKNICCRTWKVKFAAHVIRHGGVIAHPTEAIWGLACDPFNPKAVAKLLSIKQREVEKGLILVSGQPEHFQSILKELPRELNDRFLQHMTVPTTWLVPDIKHRVPEYLKGSFSSVAIRLTQYDVISELSRYLEHAIVSSSANPAGLEPAQTLLKVNQYFYGSIDYILSAPLGNFSRPSEIRDLVSQQIIRA